MNADAGSNETVRTADPQAAASAPASASLATQIGTRLRQLRGAHGLSLERLAQRCGVSRAMLSQIELGRSTPSVAVLWKIASAFGVSLAAFVSPRGPLRTRLLPAHAAPVLVSADQRSVLRTLYPPEAGCGLALYEIRLQPAASGAPQRQAPGTRACLTVALGRAELLLEGDGHALGTGDTLDYAADRPHAWRNPGTVEALLYLLLVPA